MQYTQLIRVISGIIFIFICSGILHEIGHLFMCCLVKCKVIEIKIFIFKIFFDKDIKLKISILEREHCTFSTNSEKKMIKVMLMGPLVNFIIAIFFFILSYIYRYDIIVLFGFLINIYLAVYNILPSTCGDGYTIYNSYVKIMNNRIK